MQCDAVRYASALTADHTSHTVASISEHMCRMLLLRSHLASSSVVSVTQVSYDEDHDERHLLYLPSGMLAGASIFCCIRL